jgi:hypothetical protein
MSLLDIECKIRRRQMVYNVNCYTPRTSFLCVGFKARRTHPVAGAVACMHVAGVADTIGHVVATGGGG